MSTASHQEIEMRAYHLWVDRGKPWGTPDVDWYTAEKELVTEGSALSKVAREVGTALGTMVAFFSDGDHAAADRS
jgi:hypothetical protein